MHCRTSSEGFYTPSNVLIWFVSGVVAAVGVGYLAARANLSGIAPLGLLPIGVGCLLGTVLAWLAAYARVSCPIRLVIGTFVIALLTVVAEHAWLYQSFRQQWREARANSAQLAMFRPETPWSVAEYLGREISVGSAPYWVLDAVLITVVAVVTVNVVSRKLAATRVASDAANFESRTPDT